MKTLKQISILFFIILYFLITKSFAETGKVNTEAVRIRKEPNTNSDILTTIYIDDEIEVLGSEADWYKVSYNGTEGYISKQYLTIETSNTANQTNTTVNDSNNTSNTVVNEANNTSEVNNTTSENQTEIQEPTIPENEKNSIETNQYILSTIVNLRTIPNISSKIITQLPQNTVVTKTLELNNWTKVTNGDIEGWVPKNKLTSSNETPEPQPESTEEVQDQSQNTEQPENTEQTDTVQSQPESNTNRRGVVNVETANVRETASTSSTIIGFLDYNDVVTIVAEEGDWYKVEGEDASGYVSKNLITINVSSRSLSEVRENTEDDTVVSEQANNAISNVLANETQNSGISVQIVEYAKQFLGYSYVSGGRTPSSGFDCSGFTQYVYGNFGYTLGNTASAQNNVGVEISRNEMNVGDLILFYDEGKNKIGHTGIYIGDGNFIHAANPNRGVVIDNLNTNTYYNTRIVSIKRIV